MAANELELRRLRDKHNREFSNIAKLIFVFSLRELYSLIFIVLEIKTEN